ncbi:CRTAC1 family protein [Roseiconus nitratireducens]|uniref:CRTAC1 family protein n=1 Tax=Roseiconus nitratireducens TaxID=2605748 RepID=A0A5M6DHD8_9BACT|nr:FG-GAP-like repeat-containing protein [Roseiconus nitratireducens]KAA5546863.1 CRTAC1 family protein [Roseiconus nitratireducens]
MSKPKAPETDRYEEEEVLRDDAEIGRAFRRSLIALVALLAIGAVAAFLLSRPKPSPPVKETELAEVKTRQLPDVKVPSVTFTDVTEQAGIDFVHNNGAVGDKLLPETMGGGVAALDFDNDGDQDLLFVNSQDWPWDSPSDRSKSSMLYRNDGGEFVDVTEASGLKLADYAMGVAVGDYDNDGRVDVFITSVGANHLFHNLGEGRFEEVTDSAGVGGEANRWSTSAGWFDYDNDGDLDLFVCNYVQWSREYDQSQNFQLVGGGRAYGRPQNFEGTFPYLYRNDGDGKFVDVSEEAGVQVRNEATGVPLSKSLGLAFCDFDANGTLDVIVANDTVQNLLLRNDGEGHFSEVGALTGIAFDSSGNARGAMGIDVASFRGRKALAVAIGNFSNEMTALYVTPTGRMQFYDEAVSTGLGPSTRLLLTFGLFYLDYDLDGRSDLFCANGHLEEDINRVQPSQHYEQPPQMFWNAGPKYGTEFLPVGPEQVGEDLLKPIAGRGAAYADFDGDGDLDIVITSTGRAPRLLRNDQQLGHHWLRLKLRGDGKQCNRDAIGSWVELTVGDEVLRQQVMPTRSYLSQVELPITFGLGESDRIDSMVIHWADGHRQEVDPPEVDQMQVIERQ